jgi:hypothetical protein
MKKHKQYTQSKKFISKSVRKFSDFLSITGVKLCILTSMGGHQCPVIRQSVEWEASVLFVSSNMTYIMF